MFIDYLAADMTLPEFLFWLLVVFVGIPAMLTYLRNPRQSSCQHDFELIDEVGNIRKYECRVCKKAKFQQVEQNAAGDWVVVKEEFV